MIIRWNAKKYNSVAIEEHPQFYGTARFWNRIVRSRAGWITDRSAIEAHQERARGDLRALGFDQAHLDSMGAAEHVEIGANFVDDDIGFAERIFPWEYVLSSATLSDRRARSLVVTRHLNGVQRGNGVKKIKTFLFVKSSPGALENIYSFSSEYGNLKSIIEKNDLTFIERDTPTLRQLQTTIVNSRPDIIHLTGIDAHEGARLLELADNKRSVKDGFFLQGSDGTPQDVDYIAMANALQCDDEYAPRLVTYNCEFGASRLAALAVAKGAMFSIGFQDTLDESLAENFYINFFHAFSQTPDHMLQVFRQTFESLKKNTNSLRGSGIVLWSHKSLIAEKPKVAKAKTSRQDDPQMRQTITGTGNGGDGAKMLAVEVAVVGEGINYSMLHNGRSLFDKFRLAPNEFVRIENVEVRVHLQLGADKYPYRTSFDVSESRDIRDEIILPLTWESVGALHESVITTLYVEVSVKGSPVYRDTHKVTLHPLNEWKDNERDGAWLPSFILPRDPAVDEIIGLARWNLKTLNDDHAARFDGYQSRNAEIVDRQVQAIWSALAYHHDLGYIEPPPTYTKASQRLRTPSDVLKSRQGTCIDLCLMFAACLEYIGIYPVIFLVVGHAFPGYWRNDWAHNHFTTIGSPDEVAGPNSVDDNLIDANPDARPFEYRSESVETILQHFRNLDLTPVESTLLTSKGSFAQAIRDGEKNLENLTDFDVMIDVQHSRRAKVTPLPIGRSVS